MLKQTVRAIAASVRRHAHQFACCFDNSALKAQVAPVDAWFESEAYQQLTQAVRAIDYPRAARIVNSQIAATEGDERIFWQRLHRGLQWQVADSGQPFQSGDLWAELDEQLSAASSAKETRRSILVDAIHLCTITEQFDRLPGVLGALRPGLRQLTTGYQYWTTRSMMHRLFRRWPAAYHSASRAIDEFYRGPEARQRAMRGRLVFLYAYRAIWGLRSGKTGMVEADVSQAEAIYGEFQRPYLAPLSLGLAVAELAYWQGRLQDARLALQKGVARHQESQYRGRWDVTSIDYELLAARIARVEGNTTGFAHFCDRALTMCEEHKLPITADGVHAIRGGAEC